MRVLIVEDDQTLAVAYQECLAEFRVKHISDGTDIAFACIDFKPDVVLLDHRLPGLDGLWAVTDIKKTVPDARIVLITGDADAVQSRTALEIVNKVFLKPVNLNELVRYIRSTT